MLCVISSLVLWLLKCAACSLLSFGITIFHSLNRSKELQLKIPEVLLLSKFERWPPGNKRQVRFKLSTHSLGSKEFKIIGLSVHAAAAHHHHYNHSHLHLSPPHHHHHHHPLPPLLLLQYKILPACDGIACSCSIVVTYEYCSVLGVFGLVSGHLSIAMVHIFSILKYLFWNFFLNIGLQNNVYFALDFFGTPVFAIIP